MENTAYEPGIWYGWNGGKCPVHPMTVVAVRFRDRTKEHSQCDSAPASRWSWNHYAPSGAYEIVAFMIITPYVEPRKPREIWVNEYPEGLGDLASETKEEADRHTLSGRIRCVKFVEVIEE